MPDSLIFDPELEGLLREIAADPRSRLLRLPRPTRPRDLLAIPEPVTRARSGLSLAERHLLEVHRNELAQVLQRACILKFFNDPDRSVYLNRNKKGREYHRPEAASEWRASAGRLIESTRELFPTSLGSMHLVEACVTQLGAEATILQLARASQVLRSSDIAEAYVGLDLALAGKHSDALSVMMPIVSRHQDRYLMSCVLENVALAESSAGSLGAACNLYQDSALIDNSRSSPRIGWLFMALQVGDWDSVRRASAALDEGISGALEVAKDLSAKYRMQVVQGALVFSSTSMRLAQNVVDHFGPAPREVANVLLG